MEKFDMIEETVDAGVSSESKHISLLLTLSSLENEPDGFTTSIDELGQIVLTPVSKDAEFLFAEIISEDTSVDESSIKEEEHIVKTFRVDLVGTLLIENSNTTLLCAVDEIGQVVIQPEATENMFISAVIDDSLNLITEEATNKEEVYLNFKIFEEEGKWHVSSLDGDVIEDTFDSKNKAKIFVCESELARLMLEENPVGTEESEPEDISDTAASDIKTVEETIRELTSEYSEVDGALTCDTDEERDECCKALRDNSYEFEITPEENKIKICYKKVVSMNESVDIDLTDIVARFMRGEVPLFSDSGEPSEKYIPVTDLDANGYRYYYDNESGSIISYPAKED